jgi:hypothetical protein
MKNRATPLTNTEGVVQSNGPQIDPGYRGALFCMLYNGSDQPVGIMRGQHFSTVEFITTCGNGPGYQGKYQGMMSLSDFMPASAAVSKGGQILEKTEKKIADVADQWTLFRNVLLGFLALIVSPAYVVYFNVWSKWQDAKTSVDEKMVELIELESELLGLKEVLEKQGLEIPSPQAPEEDAGDLIEGGGADNGDAAGVSDP